MIQQKQQLGKCKSAPRVTESRINLRRFRDSDAKAVADLSNANSQFFQYPSVTPDFIVRISRDPKYDMFVLEDDSRIVGFCGINHASWPLAEMGPLCVRADYRRQGFGRILVQRIIEFARRLNNLGIIIKVRPSNIGAQRFFRALGFEKSHKEMVHGELAIVMKYEL